MDNTAIENVRIIGAGNAAAAATICLARLRNETNVAVSTWEELKETVTYPIYNYRRDIVKPIFLSEPTPGATGKPKRNKTKTRAARKARKRNY